eukprot:TRINITY_DN21530_c0_g1_i2.p1 TRINITY_DN21530_c0_g1~~TRINITY_DN21530_c0_g1_i2.p1  ORF type:complete len:176 (-),score=39.76 TRINITY_DN21530_c0_g1_i2:310-837(-)
MLNQEMEEQSGCTGFYRQGPDGFENALNFKDAGEELQQLQLQEELEDLQAQLPVAKAQMEHRVREMVNQELESMSLFHDSQEKDLIQLLRHMMDPDPQNRVSLKEAAQNGWIPSSAVDGIKLIDDQLRIEPSQEQLENACSFKKVAGKLSLRLKAINAFRAVSPQASPNPQTPTC